MIKQLAKSVLPSSAIQAALSMRDAYRLAMQPRLTFEPTSLRRSSDVDLAAILQPDSVLGSWDVDHHEIATAFGEDDRFGGVNPGDRRALYYLIRALRPARVLEVGTHIGASTLHIARALRANGSGSVTTVDITDVNGAGGAWKVVGQRMSPVEFARSLDCADRIEFVVANSLEYLATTRERYDLIFLDGDHSARTVYREVAQSLHALAPNGLILLHDYYPDGAALYPDGGVILGPYRAFVRIGREEPRIAVRPLTPLPWETKQGTKETTLALVTAR